MATQEITKRIDPCNCGCQGKDSWHARTFNRVIRNEKAEIGVAHTDLGSISYERVGIAHFPWGISRVVWHRHSPESNSGLWLVDRESMLNVQNRISEP